MSESEDLPAVNDTSAEPSEVDEWRDREAERTKLLTQAIVFSTLTLSGSALLIATLIANVDSFYPLVGFFVAVYVAWRRFF